MKLIIDIEKDYYEILKHGVEHGDDYRPIKIIANGTPHPCPCDLCRYNPPSSADGKPCSMCVAEGRE